MAWKTPESVIVPYDAEVMRASSPPLAFPEQLPDDREACLQLIETAEQYVARFRACLFWAYGKIGVHLMELGEKNVVEEIAQRTGYKARSVEYMLAIARAFTLDQVNGMCQKGLEYSHIRELASPMFESLRESLVDDVLNGAISAADVHELISKRKINETQKAQTPDLLSSPEPAMPEPAAETEPEPPAAEEKIEKDPEPLSFKEEKESAGSIESLADWVEATANWLDETGSILDMRAESMAALTGVVENPELTTPESREKIIERIEDICKNAGILVEALGDFREALHIWLQELKNQA